MGKTTDLLMGTIYDRNGMQKILKEVVRIQRRLYKRDLHDPDNHECVIIPTHLEPDILECEVRWALGSITTKKAS